MTKNKIFIKTQKIQFTVIKEITQKLKIKNIILNLLSIISFQKKKSYKNLIIKTLDVLKII